jgi:hypothetical protein
LLSRDYAGSRAGSSYVGEKTDVLSPIMVGRITIKFLKETVIKVSGATFLGVAVLLIGLTTPQTANALVWVQNTITPTGFSNYNDVTDNYAYSYGVLFNNALYNGVRTIYVNACADSSSYTATQGVVWNLNESPSSGPVASTTTGYMADCDDYASTTSDYTQWSYVVFDEPVSLGTLYDDQYVFAVHLSGTNDGFYYEPADTGDDYVTYGCVKPPNSSYDCNSYDNSYTIGFAIDTTAEDAEPPVYSAPASNYTNPDYTNTKFTNLIISSTTGYVNFEVDYYLDPDEYDSSVSAKNPTTFSVSLSQKPSTDFTTYGYSLNGSTGNQTADGDWSSVLDDGVYDYLIKFSNFGCSSGLSACPFPQSYISGDFTISGGVITATSTPDYYTAERFAGWIETGETPYHECGLTDITGCLKNVVIWAFVPADFSTTYWENTKLYAETKTPFVYAFQFQDQMETLASSASGTIPTLTVDMPFLGEITFLDNAWFSNGSVLDLMAAIIRPISVGLIYLLLMITLWKRTKRFTYSLTNSHV